MAGPNDFTGQNIQDTYQRVLQISSSGVITDGTGSIIQLTSSSIQTAITVSHALFAVSASHEITFELSSSHAVNADTASFATNFTASGNISASGDIIGNNISASGDIVINEGQKLILDGNDTAGLTPAGNTYIHNGGTADEIEIYVGGTQKLQIKKKSLLFNNGRFNVNGNITASGTGNLRASGTIVASNLSGTNTGDQDLSNLVTNSQTSSFLVPADTASFLVPADTASFAITGSDVVFNHISASGNISGSIIEANGLELTGNVTASSIVIETSIIHEGDPNTAIGFLDDLIVFQAGGNNFLSYTSATDTITLSGSISSNITASGNISASGNIIATGTGSFGRAEFESENAIQLKNNQKIIFENAAGTEFGNVFINTDDQMVFQNLRSNKDVFIRAGNSGNEGNVIIQAGGSTDSIATFGTLEGLHLSGSLTASGNISASGEIIGIINGGSF